MNAQGNTYMGKKVALRLTTINKSDVTNCGDLLNV
jgi:hypothetical protein